MRAGENGAADHLPYPLKLEPLLRETIWGGNRLEPLVAGASSGRQIGEAWLAWEGLGISNGPLRGRTLAEAVTEDARGILGEMETGETFPLLVKLIDAGDNLSVQVHPDDGYAGRHEGGSAGKSEVWLVLDAEQTASVIHGVKRRVDAREIGRAVEAARLGDLLESVPVRAGDVIYNAAGTVHALGAGILIYELQQSSDITYRLYDWGRAQADGSSRELHVEKSIDVLTMEPYSQHKISPVRVEAEGCERSFLCACRYFAAERIGLTSPLTQSTEDRRFDILTVIEGEVEVQGGEERVRLRKGESAVVPAGLGNYEVRPTGSQAVLVKAYVPDLRRDIVDLLRGQGTPNPEILQLGGDLLGNDLARVMSNE